MRDGYDLVRHVVLDTSVVGGNNILHLYSLAAAERDIGDDVESDQCATVLLEGLESLRSYKDAYGAAREHGARDSVVAALAVGKVKQIVTVLLLDSQSLGQIDVGLQSGVDAVVVEINFHLLGFTRVDSEVVDIKFVDCRCAQSSYQA